MPRTLAHLPAQPQLPCAPQTPAAAPRSAPRHPQTPEPRPSRVSARTQPMRAAFAARSVASRRLASRARCCCGGRAGRCVGRAGWRAAARGTAGACCLCPPAMNSLDQAEGECGGPKRACSCPFGAPGGSGSAPGRAASSLRSGPRHGAALRGAKRPREASAPSPLRSSSAQTGELGRGLWGGLRVLSRWGGLLLLLLLVFSGRPAEAESGTCREGLCRRAPCAGPPACSEELPRGPALSVVLLDKTSRLQLIKICLCSGISFCPQVFFYVKYISQGFEPRPTHWPLFCAEDPVAFEERDSNSPCLRTVMVLVTSSLKLQNRERSFLASGSKTFRGA